MNNIEGYGTKTRFPVDGDKRKWKIFLMWWLGGKTTIRNQRVKKYVDAGVFKVFNIEPTNEANYQFAWNNPGPIRKSRVANKIISKKIQLDIS